MARLISCFGLWLTVGLFIALGYALGDDCTPPSTHIGDSSVLESPAAPSASFDETTCARDEDEAECEADSAENSAAFANRLDVSQDVNRVGGNPVSAPSIVLRFKDNPLCFSMGLRAVQTWR